jgi:molybdate-binding protein
MSGRGKGSWFGRRRFPFQRGVVTIHIHWVNKQPLNETYPARICLRKAGLIMQAEMRKGVTDCGGTIAGTVNRDTG